MCHPLCSETLDDLYRKARNETLDGALALFGEAITGVRGYLACNGFVVHGRVKGAGILDGYGKVIAPEQLIDYPDRVVNHLGLYVGRVSACDSDTFKTSVTMLAIRLGLLSRILDLAYDHLKERVSFGQKTLKHQLVKSTFAEVNGAVVLLMEQMRIRAERSLSIGLADDHAGVTEFTGKAEKLMGGHGYLLSGTHSLSYLSMLLFSIYGTTG